MSTRRKTAVLFLITSVVLVMSGTVRAQFGTAITYQGKLIDVGSPANGQYDFEFKLFDDPNIVTGVQVGSTITKEDVKVYDGYFTVDSDFGSLVFNGDARWLEVGVRPGGESGGFTPLRPRQELTPTPYAIYANTSGSVVDGIYGSGTGNFLPKFSGSDTIGNSVIYESVSGNVGIGTTAPSRKFTISSTTSPQLEIDSAVGPNLIAGTNSLGAFVGTMVSDNFVIYTANADRIHVTGSGNVGIGDTTPSYKLDVAGDINFTGNLYQNSLPFSGGGSLWQQSGADIYYNSGKVGIGTSSPSEELSVQGDVQIKAVGASTNLYLNSTGSYESRLNFDEGSEPRWAFRRLANDNLVLSDYVWYPTTVFDVMCWDYSTLQVGIGTTSPTSKLSIVGEIDISGSRLHVGTDDRVGIGTDSPDQELDVQGDVQIKAVGASTNLYLNSTGSYESRLNFDEGSEPRWAFRRLANDNLVLSDYVWYPTTVFDVMCWDYSTLQVGIGTTSPTNKLSVDGSADFTGRVGVGRDNPTTTLHVSRDTTEVPNTHPSAVMIVEDGDSNAYLQIMAPASNHRAVLFGETGASGQVNDGQVGYDDSDGMRFWVDRGGADLVPLQIQMDGDVIMNVRNVGMGTTSPDYKLQVNGDVCPETHKGGDLGKSGLAWDDLYYDDLYNQGAAAFTDRIITEEILRHPPASKKPGMFDYMTERGLEELDPACLPEDLHDDFSLLTDEIATYNYKANYEQQVQIDILRVENKELKTLVQSLLVRIDSLEKNQTTLLNLGKGRQK